MPKSKVASGDSKPRILVLSTGGTWCMRRKASAQRSPFEEVKVAETLGDEFDFLGQFPLVGVFSSPTFRELRAIDSSNMGPHDWEDMARCIETCHDDYDGFVVMQGTDTLSFTAAALAFALQGLGKPVVVSGAQLEMDAPGSDAALNVVNACRVASLRVRKGRQGVPVVQEVVVVFGSRIIRATRCRKYSECDLEAFDTVNVPLVGRIRTAIRIDPAMLLNTVAFTGAGRFRAASQFDGRVALLHVYPGMDPTILPKIGSDCSGVVLAAFGAGNIPCSTETFRNEYSLQPSIEALVERDTPVVITTQCVTGQAEVGLYETGSAAKTAGAIIVNDMTPEAAFVKLSWLLANQQCWPRKAKQAARGGPGFIGAVRTAMLNNLTGEITENPELYGLLGL